MANKTLTINAISNVSNYLKVEGTVFESGSKEGRAMVSYYPQKTTVFNMIEEAEETGKGTLYTNVFTIVNHMSGGRLLIPELLIGNITQGAKGKAFDETTFIAFMTEFTSN